MIEAIGALLAFTALLVAWKCWKKTARAAVRDRLFDLRDELRAHYVRNNLDMTDGVYGKTRELLNKMLLYAKSMRMMGYIVFASQIDRSVVEAAAADFDESIKKCDDATAKLIKRIRRQACEAILVYMAATSLGFISASIVTVLSLLPAKTISALKRCVHTLVEFKPATLEYVAMC